MRCAEKESGVGLGWGIFAIAQAVRRQTLTSQIGPCSLPLHVPCRLSPAALQTLFPPLSPPLSLPPLPLSSPSLPLLPLMFRIHGLARLLLALAAVAVAVAAQSTALEDALAGFEIGEVITL